MSLPIHVKGQYQGEKIRKLSGGSCPIWAGTMKTRWSVGVCGAGSEAGDRISAVTAAPRNGRGGISWV